jgi:hypothetical protein
VTVRDFFFAAGRNPFARAHANDTSTTASATSTDQFSVAVITVRLPRKVWLYRPHTGAVEGAGEGLDFERNTVYPEEIQDTGFGTDRLFHSTHSACVRIKSCSLTPSLVMLCLGLTQLQCSGELRAGDWLVDSIPVSQPAAQSWLAPLDQAHEQPLYQLLSSV